MSRKRPQNDERDVIGTKPTPRSIGGLFDALGLPAVPPVPSLAMKSGRELAKEEADRTLSGRQAKILAALTAHGPMDRLQIAATTGLTENSTNSGCHALLAAKKLYVLRTNLTTKRGVLAVTPKEDA